MSKRIASILVCGVLGSIFSLEVQAMPVSPGPAHAVTPLVTLVRGFCGLGFHRSPYGYCLRNGVPYGYVPAYPPPPVVVGVPYVCPFGFYVGPYGHCHQY
jgi:hypothetical protein